MEHPLVTFVVRTIPERGVLLSRALASIAAQTIQDYEIQVVEDGGDTARALVMGTAKAHYISLPRVGRCAAGNAALRGARGVYCCFLDDDDEVYPHHLAALLPLLEKTAAPAAFALADVMYGMLREAPRAAPPFWTLRVHNIMPIQAVLFRRELFLQHGGLAEDLDHFEDWELWLRYASKGGAFAHAPVVTSFYRMPEAARSYHKRHMTALRYYPVVAMRARDYTFADGGRGLKNRGMLSVIKQRLLAYYPCFLLWRLLRRVAQHYFDALRGASRA